MIYFICFGNGFGIHLTVARTMMDMRMVMRNISKTDRTVSVGERVVCDMSLIRRRGGEARRAGRRRARSRARALVTPGRPRRSRRAARRQRPRPPRPRPPLAALAPPSCLRPVCSRRLRLRRRSSPTSCRSSPR